MSQYLRDRWESDNGFPGGAVHAITQTADGYLWIAADKGLVRFDGWTFHLFLPPGATSGSDLTVRALAANSDGSLWIQLRSARLLRYRQGEFTDVTVDPDRKTAFVTAMSHGIDEAMLFALIGHYVIVSRAGRFDTMTPQNVIATPGSFVISIAQTADGDVWLGTRDSGLLHVHDGRVTRIVKGLPDEKINSLLTNALHDLWVGTDNGVARWNGSEFTRVSLPKTLNHLSALAMIRDRDSNVWIGTASSGLLRINGGGLTTLDEPGKNRSPAVTAIFEDRDRNVWFGTTRGIERLRDGVFTSYSGPQGLPPSGGYGPVYVESDRIWIAPADGGLLCLRGGRVTPVEAGGLKNDVIYSITGGTGGVWLGRQRGGLTQVRADGDTFAARTFTHVDGLAQNNVYAVQRAADRSVWAGTLSGGVSRFKDDVFKTYTTEDGLASNTVAAIVEGADGTMWFATPNGVSAFTHGEWRRFAVGDGLPSNDVNTLFEDSIHDLWIGTAAGLVLFRGGRIQPVLQHLPVLGGSILGLAEDRSGSLWIMTSDRVLRVNRERLAFGALIEEDLREYGLADGLLGIESVKRHRTVVADDRGRIWLSMNRGLAMADPLRVAGHGPPVLVHVEGISADGSPLERRDEVAIPPRRQRITVAFTGLSLSVPERVMFRYRLDGFDRDWSEPTSLRQAVYTNLGPGKYKFRVIASNSDGVWNPAGSTMRFTIAPAFWQTSWFRLSALLLLTALGWTGYRVRLGQVARQLNVRFEDRLAERTRIAQELHDTLLQGFVSASMQLHVAADRLPADSSAKSSLGRVVALMGRVIEEGRNAVRSLRSSSSESLDLERAFSGIADELGSDGNPAYFVIVEGKVRPLNPIIRDDVYRIGREALVNAFRHSNAQRIEIELRYGSSELRMLVRDNGSGIDAQVLKSGREGHWGLPGMRERAERIGARLKVWSSASAGTEVELSVPGQLAFAREPSDGRR